MSYKELIKSSRACKKKQLCPGILSGLLSPKITIYNQLLGKMSKKTGKNLAPGKDTKTKVVLARNCEK